jgi:hypothetical protein
MPNQEIGPKDRQETSSPKGYVDFGMLALEGVNFPEIWALMQGGGRAQEAKPAPTFDSEMPLPYDEFAQIKDEAGDQGNH